MTRIVLLLIAAFSLGLLLVLAERLVRPLAGLVRTLTRGLAAILIVAGVAVAASGLADETWWAAIMGGAVAAVGMRLAWSLRRGRRRAVMPGEPEHIPLTRSVPHSDWQRFEAQLDWVARHQARKSRAAIDRFIAERNSPSLTHEHRSLLLSCEKRVPELIETCLERCGNASPQARDRYIDETLDTLNQIGTEAERARREVREADDRRLEMLHRYFDGVAGEDGPKPPPR